MRDEDIRRLLSAAARSPSRPVGPAGIRRRASRRRVIFSGSIVGVVVGIAAAVVIAIEPPTRDLIIAEPSSTSAATEPAPTPEPNSEPPARRTGSPSPSAPVDTSEDPAQHESPRDPETERHSDPTPEEEMEAGSAQSSSADHGQLLWGRTFLVVQVTEDGEVTRVPPEEEPWPTNFFGGREPSQGDVGWHWGGCNWTGASITVTEDRLTIGSMGGPSGGCDDAARQARDVWSIEFFESDPYWRLEGDRLWLWSGDAIVELEEDRADDG